LRLGGTVHGDTVYGDTVALLAVRVLLAPCFVVAVSLVGRRFGTRIGGVVAGLPIIAGPVLLVVALDHGPRFASRAAVGVVLGLVGVAAFVLAYVAAASRLAWPGAIVSAYGAFALAVVAMRPVSVGPLPALLIAVAALTLTLALLPRPARAAGRPPAYPRWDLPLRAVCTATAVVTVTAVAATLGPHLSGLLTSLPIVTAVLPAFTHAHRGRDEATRLLRGFTVGFFAYAAFGLVVATTVRPLGIAACFVLATVAAFAVQAAAIAENQRRGGRATPQPSGARA
jgi:hypothetical protein